jgi:streptomycin 6-kinase
MIDQPPRDLVLVKLGELRDEMQAGFASLREEQARTNASVAAMARTLVTVQRDIRLLHRDLTDLKDRVTVLTIASDDHPPAHV